MVQLTVTHLVSVSVRMGFVQMQVWFVGAHDDAFRAVGKHSSCTRVLISTCNGGIGARAMFLTAHLGITAANSCRLEAAATEKKTAATPITRDNRIVDDSIAVKNNRACG